MLSTLGVIGQVRWATRIIVLPERSGIQPSTRFATQAAHGLHTFGYVM